MATGTGNLPNQGMDAVPFTPITSQWGDEVIENIESLADGSGIGDEAIKASNIDWTTFTLGYVEKTSAFNTTSSTPVQITDLTVTVTIPPGVTNVEVSAYFPVLYCAANNNAALASIWQGTVGSGTILQTGRSFQSGGSGTGSPLVSRRIPVTPGATITFNAGLAREATISTTAYSEGASSRPMWLMVKVS